MGEHEGALSDGPHSSSGLSDAAWGLWSSMKTLLSGRMVTGANRGMAQTLSNIAGLKSYVLKIETSLVG